MTVICAEAPIALLVEPWGVVPLTPCCAACASVGGDYGFYCKACYGDVDMWFGDCWNTGDAAAWQAYRQMLLEFGAGPLHAARIAGYAKAKAAAL